MKLAAITRSLQADMQAELRDLERATAVGTKEAGRGLRTELRRQVASAGLGQRLANSWRDKHYPNQKLDAASLVYTKAPQIIRAFDEGAVIRSKRGRFLAIPTENAPARRHHPIAPSRHAGRIARPGARHCCRHEGSRPRSQDRAPSPGCQRRARPAARHSWRDKHYPDQKLDAASLVYTKAPQIIRAFDEGAVIRSRRGRFSRSRPRAHRGPDPRRPRVRPDLWPAPSGHRGDHRCAGDQDRDAHRDRRLRERRTPRLTTRTSAGDAAGPCTRGISQATLSIWSRWVAARSAGSGRTISGSPPRCRPRRASSEYGCAGVAVWDSLFRIETPEDGFADYVAACRATGQKPFLDGPHFGLPWAESPA